MRNSFITIAVMTLTLLAGERSFALPVNGEVTSGMAAISIPSPALLHIEQQSRRAIINWSSFGIGNGETVNITQPESRSALLNRVLGEDPSKLFGALTANGRVFLLNPNGIVFGRSSSVNTGSLVASTMEIRDSDFLADKYAFFNNGKSTSVINQGTMHGDFVALLGSTINNTGTIITTRGTTAMAAGERITLNIDPCGFVALKVDQSTYNAQITNSGVIEADGGKVIISASAADALLSSVVNNSGKIRAESMTERDGCIIIEGGSIINTGTCSAAEISVKADNLIDAGTWNATGEAGGGRIQFEATGRIEQTAASHMRTDGDSGGQIHLNAAESLYLSGTLSANGSSGWGGQITVTAPQTILAGTRIQANGQSGGGTILIGGGWQGRKSDLKNAANTTATKSSSMTANALENGNGGTIVLWSEHETVFDGTIEAKGGKTRGNGGQVEVSGHELLNISGQVVTGAPHGENGFLLLDPRNITITESAAVPPFSLVPLPDANPAAGDQHGSGDILELDNGNIIVASPFDDFIATDAGAVRLYKPDGTLLSMLCGSTGNDMAGKDVIALTGNHNAVILTPAWSNAAQASAGAVTWIDGNKGVSGAISESNSLVGVTANDGVASTVIALANGNFVVSSPDWDNGAATDAGAVTWGNGLSGTVGIIQESNSLVGSRKNDQVGTVTALTNGNYVVSSPFWDKGTVTNAGAVTWVNGLYGETGLINAGNSLVGSKAGDQVGTVTALTNGNFVVSAPNWDNGSITNAGVITLVNGLSGATGTISAAKSLVGAKKEDKAGREVTALKNGNYVVYSPTFDNGAVIDAGAVTWGDGVDGTTGVISPSNSLVGSSTDDLASAHVTALSNGNYILSAPLWDNGSLTDAGAVTWVSGLRETSCVINSSNSLVGSTANDGIGKTVTALNNGNYVITSPKWDNGASLDAGAVTWGDGIGGTVGVISTANSLVGSAADDVDRSTVTPLVNGHYVVGSPYWDNGTATNAGAVTWCNGVGGTVGVISPANSLVGSTKNDYAGSESTGSNNVTALTNGNYVVASTGWDRGTTVNAGAVTWGNGLGGTVGIISVENSVTGSGTGDQVGSVTALPNGSYIITSPLWNSGSVTNAGAVTWKSGLTGTNGSISSLNSLVGSGKEDQLGLGGVTPLNAGNMSGSFVLSSFNRSNKTGGVDILTPNEIPEFVQHEYTAIPDTDNTFTPAQITALLNAGNHVMLKANNDITINSPIITDNPLGKGGNLALSAGKSILINADITTDDGDLLLVANDTQANGVVDAWRSQGNAVIAMAAGTVVDAGSGNVVIELRDGAGNTNRESNEISLRTITAGSISAINQGTTANSGITLASGTLAAGDATGSTIILAGKNFDNSSKALLKTSKTARWLVYSDSPGTTIKGGLTSLFRHYNASYTSYPSGIAVETGNGFIYRSTPGMLSVNTILTSGKNSSMYRTRPSATFGYTLSGFADNEDRAENIALVGTMKVRGVPTSISNIGNYVIEYDGGLSSSAGYTFASGIALRYTVEKQPINVDDYNPIQNWQSDTEPGGQKVPVGGNLFLSFNQKLIDVTEKQVIIKKSVPADGKKAEKGSFIASNNIALPETAEAFFIFPLPDNMFMHTNPDTIVSLEVHSVNGSSIPSWMSFDPKRRIISGKAPKEAKGEYRIELVAKDRFGGEGRSVVLIIIS